MDLLTHDLPGIYQLLPDERYNAYFYGNVSYRALASIGPLPETKISGTYKASESTIYNSPARAIEHYSLTNDTLVDDSLILHALLDRKTWLNETFALYSTDLETINGLDYTVNAGSNMFRMLKNGDGTVPELSAYDLVGLIDENTLVPNPQKTRRFSGIEHNEMQYEPVVMRCLLELIL